MPPIPSALLECPLRKGYIEFEYTAGDTAAELKHCVLETWGTRFHAPHRCGLVGGCPLSLSEARVGGGQFWSKTKMARTYPSKTMMKFRYTHTVHLMISAIAAVRIPKRRGTAGYPAPGCATHKVSGVLVQPHSQRSWLFSWQHFVEQAHGENLVRSDGRIGHVAVHDIVETAGRRVPKQLGEISLRAVGHLLVMPTIGLKFPAKCSMVRRALYHSAWVSTGLPCRGVTTQF
jgi:hypothetical protein